LSETGLSSNETKVYLASLALGPATVKEIAEKARLKRATVYYTLEQLKQKTLMQEIYEGLKRKFQPHNPDLLETLYEQRKKHLHEALPELRALYNLRGGNSTVQYFEGTVAVRSAYEQVLQSLTSRDFYYVIANEDFWKKSDSKFFSEYRKRRAAVAVEAKIVLVDTPAAREVKRLQRNYNSNVKLLSPEVPISTNLIVIPKLLLMHQLIEPNTALVIENPSIVQMQKELFEIMWKSLPE
jgi:sugar-specific transcriptional regulator TrmB